jgi:hypothetical protein
VATRWPAVPGRRPRPEDPRSTWPPAGDTLGLLVGEAVRGTECGHPVQDSRLTRPGRPPAPAAGGAGGRGGAAGWEHPTVAFTVLLTGGGTLVVRVRSADSSATMRMAPFGSGVARRLFHLEMVGSEPWLEVSS